jgi:hypothetical protein
MLALHLPYCRLATYTSFWKKPTFLAEPIAICFLPYPGFIHQASVLLLPYGMDDALPCVPLLLVAAFQSENGWPLPAEPWCFLWWPAKYLVEVRKS